MGAQIPLWQPSANVVLDVNGNGMANIGPQRVREHWQPTAVSVSVGTQVKESRCSVFLGSSISPATFLSTTFTGSSGDTCGCGGQDMQPGMQVWAVWSGGDPGSTATMVVNGTYSIGAPS